MSIENTAPTKISNDNETIARYSADSLCDVKLVESLGELGIITSLDFEESDLRQAA